MPFIEIFLLHLQSLFSPNIFSAFFIFLKKLRTFFENEKISILPEKQVATFGSINEK